MGKFMRRLTPICIRNLRHKWPMLIISSLLIMLVKFHASELITFKITERSSHPVATLTETFLHKMKLISQNVQKAGQEHRNGEYIIISNLVTAKNYFFDTGTGYDSSKVTWCSQGSESNLFHIIQLASQWDGPLSIAVFTHGTGIRRTLEYLSALNLCDVNIRRKVSFHLVIPAEHYVKNNSSLEVRNINRTSCKEMLAQHYRLRTKNYNDALVPFPINILRNLAMQNVDTQFVLNVDIDLLPSKYLNTAFAEFINSHGEEIRNKTSFALPSFETKAEINKSITKERLLEMWDSGHVRPFYSAIFNNSQKNTDYARWRSLPVRESINVGYHRDWSDRWEPYLIIKRKEVPRFDERFKQFGYNRNSQVCELYISGFKFAILDNAFLVHRGFKDRKSFHGTRLAENKRNRKLFMQFHQELQKRYPNTGRHCI